MATLTKRAALAALGAAAATALAASPALAASFDVGSGQLTWNVPREAAPGTGTLANYATTIGGGSVDATAPATGASITPAGLPAAGAGVKYPFVFPAAPSGTPAKAGTYDPVTRTGAVDFAGTVTFTAHDESFFSVVNPRLSFDAPQSIRLVANGKVASGTVGSSTPPADYGTATAARQTVFALDGAAATQTVNSDGSVTISNLVPAGTPQGAPTSYISSNAAFDGIRTWFGLDRANQGFSITLAPVATTPPDPDPDPTPVGSTQSLNVNGDVGNALDLTLNATTASLGTFLPGVAANYDASVTGTATSTGPSVLWVQDAGSNPGLLVNGTTPLASPLKVCGTSSASPTCTYSPLSGSAQQLLGFASATAAAPLTVGLRQSIGATDALSAGTYGKTLTFTLAAGTP